MKGLYFFVDIMFPLVLILKHVNVNISLMDRGETMTLKKIASETGVSMITVSRVIHSPEKVGETTRKRVQDAIDRHNYTPNKVAQALVYKRTNIIYLYIPVDLESTHPFVMQLIAGITSYLGDKGYSVLLRREWYSGERCDGIILVGLTLENERMLSELSDKKPIILFGHNDIVDWIDVDNYLGSYQMTQYVIDKKKRNIAYIGIDQDKKFTTDRLKGFEHAMQEAAFNDPYIKLVDNKEHFGYEAALALLKEDPTIDAIVCASDYLAIGVMRAANKLNIEVPGSLGVTGFDGLGYEYLTTPNLTTVRQPIYSIGKDLAHCIIKKINGKNTTRTNRYVAPEIIEKQSI